MSESAKDENRDAPKSVNVPFNRKTYKDHVKVVRDVGTMGKYSDKQIDGCRIEIFQSSLDKDSTYESGLKALHDNFKTISENYKNAISYFVKWYNNSDDDEKISKKDVNHPYSIVYFEYNNSCEFCFKINKTPYAVEMKINKDEIKYSCYEI